MCQQPRRHAFVSAHLCRACHMTTSLHSSCCSLGGPLLLAEWIVMHEKSFIFMFACCNWLHIFVCVCVCVRVVMCAYGVFRVKRQTQRESADGVRGKLLRFTLRFSMHSPLHPSFTVAQRLLLSSYRLRCHLPVLFTVTSTTRWAG